MAFRLGLVLGLAIGYVLGARAGRERYLQIEQWAQKVSRSQPAQQLSNEVRSAASRAGGRLETKASEKVSQVTNLVRSSGNGPT